MRITGLLLKPDLDHLRNDFLGQQNELQTFHYAPELAREVGIFVEKGLAEIDATLFALTHAGLLENANPRDFYATFRRLKLGLHFARRKMRRVISTRTRIQKIQERRSHVSTLAAGTVHSNAF